MPISVANIRKKPGNPVRKSISGKQNIVVACVQYVDPQGDALISVVSVPVTSKERYGNNYVKIY